jgi:phage terminase large subunit-like protein
VSLASTYTQQGDFEKSFQYINEALRIDKKYRDAYILKGTNYLTLGNRKLAKSSYETAIQQDTKFFEDMQAFENMLDGEAKDNPHWFGLLYGLDPQDDWRDPSTWAKANPMHGISIYQSAIEERCEQAKLKPAALNEFLCKTLNVYVSANDAWIDRQYWDDSVGDVWDEEPSDVFIGFDLAATRDLNAVCTLKRYSEDRFYADFKFFLPEDGLKLVPTHYQDIFQQAVKSGILHITEGNVMDDREISEYIKNQATIYNVKEVGYDAYNAASLIARLNEIGIPVKKVGQGMAVLSNPSKHTEKLVMSHAIRHDGNPFLGWQIGNCDAWYDINGNVKVRKNEDDKAAKAFLACVKLPNEVELPVEAMVMYVIEVVLLPLKPPPNKP